MDNIIKILKKTIQRKNEKYWSYFMIWLLIWLVITQETFVLKALSPQNFKTSSLQDVFKTSWSRRTYSSYSYICRRRLNLDQYIRLGHTCSRRLQNIFKMSGQDISKTSSRRLAKTPSRHLQDVWKCFQELFKTSC